MNRNSWTRTRRSNIHVLGIPEGKEKEKMQCRKISKKIIAENFSNLSKSETYRFKKLSESPKGDTQRNPCLDTLSSK